MKNIYAVVLAAVVLAGCDKIVLEAYCPREIEDAALNVVWADFYEARQGNTGALRSYANSIDDFCVRASLIDWAEYYEKKKRAKEYMAQIRGMFPAPFLTLKK